MAEMPSSLRLILATLGLTLALAAQPIAGHADKSAAAPAAAHPMKNFLGDAAYPDPYWKPATPASERIDEAKLNAAVAHIAAKGWEIHGLVVTRRGKLVFERYGWKSGRNADDPDKTPHQVLPNERHLVHSTTKSVTSALFGIALEEGRIPKGVDARVLGFFPEWAPLANPSADKDALRIADLLTMRSGLQYQEGPDDDAIFFKPDSPTRAYLSRPIVGTPVGTKWNYSSASTGVVAAILQKVTGQNLRDYAAAKLLGPLGIVNPPWAAGKDGVPFGGFGLELTPREMARFGELYRLNGQWNGRQLVPEKWIAESTRAHAATPWNGEYGYQWWLPKRLPSCYATRGAYGQDVFVCPSLALVVAFTSDMPLVAADANLDALMADYILPAVQP